MNADGIQWRIRRAGAGDADAVTDLALRLWPHHTREELASETAEMLADADCAVFLASEGEAQIGFAHISLRREYVEGTDSSPVGYLEGVFVDEARRGLGVGRALVEAGEDWARGRGCREFASDCELHNLESLAFHLKIGFAEQNRVICFAKGL